mmetsp:Transcript_42898/g.110707  ORF Transcript_42898/g.110707 Transcript_42898/m.110707 type:complete len:175 (+) Transcript_42898:175-699(+)
MQIYTNGGGRWEVGQKQRRWREEEKSRVFFPPSSCFFFLSVSILLTSSCSPTTFHPVITLEPTSSQSLAANVQPSAAQPSTTLYTLHTAVLLRAPKFAPVQLHILVGQPLEDGVGAVDLVPHWCNRGVEHLSYLEYVRLVQLGNELHLRCHAGHERLAQAHQVDHRVHSEVDDS